MSAPHSHRRRPARGSLLPFVLPLLALTAPPAAADTMPPAPASAATVETAEPPPLRLVVNVPAFRLDVYEDGSLAASYPVTVGMPSEPTPTGHFRLQKVVWNPWWHPPDNRRPKDKVTPPGPRNPMGKVKLSFTNLYYLHGTPKEHEIGSPASRGCIRLRNEDAVAVAQLVHRHAIAPLPAGKLEEMAGTRSRRTSAYPLEQPVPLDVLYDLVDVRDGELRVYRDLYHDARFPLPELAARALEGAGYSRERLDLAALSGALAETATAVAPASAKTTLPAAREVLRLPLAQLLLPAGEVAAIAGGASANR